MLTGRRGPDLTGRPALVTGAASGIGRALAVRLAAEGAVVHLTDLQAEGLAETAATIAERGGRVGSSETLDVTDHDAVAAWGDRLTREHGAMHLVANVAGISTWGTVSALEDRHWRSLVEVNLMGPIHVIEALVPPMIEAGRGGHLVNVASAAGLIGMPWHAAYSASKFGLRGVSEVLRFDLGRHGIDVHLVCPGGVATPLVDSVTVVGVDPASPSFRRAVAGFRKHAVTPEQAAEAILTGVRRRRYLVYTSLDIRAVHLLQRYLPPAYALAMRGLSAAANRALPEVEQARRPEQVRGS